MRPALRGRGLEDAALDWLEARAAELAQRAPAGLERLLRCGMPDTVTHKINLVQARGYAPIRHFYRMRRDLRQPIPDLRLPDGLTLRTFAPELSPALHAAHNEAFSDHWGFEAETPEDWELFYVTAENFRPDLTLLALDGGQIAAYSINRVYAEDNARTGDKAAQIGQLGTRRAWRKRGLASALLCESMRRFREAGFETVTLGVDSENLTGALAIYERLGFTVDKRFITFGKAVGLAAGAALLPAA